MGLASKAARMNGDDTSRPGHHNTLFQIKGNDPYQLQRTVANECDVSHHIQTRMNPVRTFKLK
jgi:hypothetical protein